MPTITLREVRSTEQGFEAELIFDGRSRYSITVADPFALTPAQEELLLEWYFEEWIRFPFTDRMLKQQAEDRIADYGRALFEQVFRTDPDAYSEYRQLRSALSQVQLEIEGQSPEFQALHWEAMPRSGFAASIGGGCSNGAEVVEATADSEKSITLQ